MCRPIGAARSRPGGWGCSSRAATLAIIGYGRIARRLAEVALALGMRVVVSDPYATPDDPRIAHVPFAEALAAGDIVVCLAISDASTRDLFDAAAFARMKRGARFINLSRGELVDERALEAALDSGQVVGRGDGCRPRCRTSAPRPSSRAGPT